MKPQSTRLNMSNREAFVHAVVEKYLPDSAEPHERDFIAKWNDKIYGIVYEQWEPLLKQLPSWMTFMSNSLTVNMRAGERGHTLDFKLPAKRIMVPVTSTYDQKFVPTVPLDHAIKREYDALRQSMHDYNRKQRELTEQFRKLVNSCNTSGQLYAAWPEAVEFAHCFPYQERTKFQGAAVSRTEIDLGLALAQTSVTLPEEN